MKSKSRLHSQPASATARQALATAAGYTGPIATTQTVYAYDEANGTVLYTVKLSNSATTASGKSYTYQLVFTVDQAGNPTVVPKQEHFGFGGRRC